MNQSETQAPVEAVEAVEPELTEEQKAELAAAEASIKQEVDAISAALGLEVNHAVNSTLKNVDKEFYEAEMNDINEHRKNISTITNRILMGILNDFKVELKEKNIEESSISIDAYNRCLINYANMYFSTNLAELFDSVTGNESLEIAFKQSLTIISYLLGCAIPKEYIHFDLCTVQVLHSIERQFHQSYQNELAKEQAAGAGAVEETKNDE